MAVYDVGKHATCVIHADNCPGIDCLDFRVHYIILATRLFFNNAVVLYKYHNNNNNIICQARSCLYASTQLNPHYFDKKNFLVKKMSTDTWK